MKKNELILKPCPFCGCKNPSVVVDAETEEKYGVKCFTCGACIYTDKEFDDAVETWNRRENETDRCRGA